jgi:hypothetical protein
MSERKMASQYGIITLANLEAYAGIDYSAINATKYADASVEAKITLAERMVVSKTRVAWSSSTATAGVIFVVTDLSMRLMHNLLKIDGYRRENDMLPTWDPQYDIHLASSIADPVDLIPMQGLDR